MRPSRLLDDGSLCQNCFASFKSIFLVYLIYSTISSIRLVIGRGSSEYLRFPMEVFLLREETVFMPVFLANPRTSKSLFCWLISLIDFCSEKRFMLILERRLLSSTNLVFFSALYYFFFTIYSRLLTASFKSMTSSMDS